MIRLARRRNPSEYRRDRDEGYWVYPVEDNQVDLDDTNLRYDAMSEETRIDLSLSGDVALHAVWPVDEPAYFYLTRRDRAQARSAKEVRAEFPTIAAIPTLTPFEFPEPVLTAETVHDSRFSRRSSRHFRNRLRLLTLEPSVTHTNRLEEFLAFANNWLPEVTLAGPELRLVNDGGNVIDLFYTEERKLREANWAGDGVQIFWQILLHLFTLRGTTTIILDEPDVFLHSDLQRRLLRLVQTLDCQTIIATHSSEIVFEVPSSATIWVDRSRATAIRAPMGDQLDRLASELGSLFNLRLARLLRTSGALFVEGKDLAVLRRLATRGSGQTIVSEAGLAVVPLEGEANRRLLDGFAWVAKTFLKGDVPGFVILDRDWKTDEDVSTLCSELSAVGLRPHIWERHELESYLLVPEAIARASGADASFVEHLLGEESGRDRDSVIESMFAYRWQQPSSRGRDVKEVLKACHDEVAGWWDSPQERLCRVPAKELLGRLNQRLQNARLKPLSAVAIAAAMRPAETAAEVVSLMRQIDRAVGASRAGRVRRALT